MQMQLLLNHLTSPIVIAGLILANFFMLLLVIGMFRHLSRIRRNLKQLFTGTNGENIESALIRLFHEVGEWKERQESHEREVNRLAQKLANSCGNLALMRYNAFGDVGSDLSFSLALMDDQQNGVVITSIYGREESRLYAKPVKDGQSPYHLTEEEVEVIRQASR